MSEFKKMVDDPEYDSQASSASKATIFVFIATFAYLVFYEGHSPGLIGGALFFVVGIFAVSLAISMPLFLLKKRFPKLAVVATIIDIVATVAITRFVFLWLFAQPVISGGPFVVGCPQKLPEFTLGYDSNPTDAQVDQLCICIWEKISSDKKASIVIEGNAKDIDGATIEDFSKVFGDAVRQCGGMKL